MEDRWLSVDEIGAHLDVKRDTVYKWMSKRALRAHQVGRLWKFKKHYFDDWVQKDGANDTNSENDKRM